MTVHNETVRLRNLKKLTGSADVAITRALQITAEEARILSALLRSHFKGSSKPIDNLIDRVDALFK